MTKHLILGAARPLKPLRAGLCLAIALLSLQASYAQADAFSVNKAGGAANKELMDRLNFMEQRLTDLAQRAAEQQAAPGPGQLNLPAPPGMPGVPGGEPVADEDLKLGYEVKGEMNGAVIVKKGERIQMMPRAEFERFDNQAKARARLQLTRDSFALAPPVAPPAGAPNLAAGKPPVPVPAPPGPDAKSTTLNTTAAAQPAPSPSPAAIRAAQANPAPKTLPVATIK